MKLHPGLGVVVGLALAFSSAFLSGCAEEMEPPRFAVLAPVERVPPTGAVEVRHAPPPPAPAVDDELVSRPRLSHTLRLGQETTAYDTGLRAAPAQQASNGVTVIVNNNITQQQTVAVGGGYGGGGGYGRGGYGNGYGTYGRPTYGTSPSISAPYQPQAPLTSAPPLGGNWAPPRNYGPPAMR